MQVPHSARLPTAWHGRVKDLVQSKPEAIVSVLHARYPASDEQLSAWAEGLRVLVAQLRSKVERTPSALGWWVAFEYELPREGGRRPDACIVTADEVLVVEVKATARPPPEGIDQCRAYVRDLREYHAECHNRPVSGALLVTGWSGIMETGDVTVCGADELGTVLDALVSDGPSDDRIQSWLAAPYLPLPTLVEAARMLFLKEPLPDIRRARSAGVGDAVRALREIARRAMATRTHHLVLVSGSPGAGKTLVGLQFVHEHRADLHGKASAVFLSGNGPLVEVLQHVLETKVFVQDVHRFMREYGVPTVLPPPEDVLVFDEAQRAWDREKVQQWYQEKKNLDHNLSEPETFVRIVGSREQGGVLVGLIGYGQEIHNGEEGGLGQWREAVSGSDRDWVVHCAGRLREYFQGSVVEEHGALDLSVTLRSHGADRLHLWVEHLLEGRLSEAGRVAEEMRAQGTFLYMTQDLAAARAFITARYADEHAKTFGMVASSKSKNMASYGVNTGYGSPAVLRPGQVGPWFYGKTNLPPRCRELSAVATEFQCQGLELDGGIILWGSDFVWNGTTWRIPAMPRAHARDPAQLRKNSYRVLLTRFRDGFVVYVPPGQEMAETSSALHRAGIQQLPV